MLRVLVVLTAALTLVGGARRAPAVRAWMGTIDLPTYAEGPANPNPPFDLFAFGRFNYPYPIRDALSDRREVVTWRALHLENEYLKLTVLPDLGGHIYSCVDKRTGRDMFYANSAIKKALIGYRGAWAAFGVEFNFPVSHNWMSMSPVDFATTQQTDGSASVWVGNTDQVYGGRWVVELRLYPGRSALEQRVDLYNSGDVRHRYYWWSNGAVQAWEDSRLFYPTELMSTHGFTSIEPWPVDRRGKDLSVIRNQTDGPVSLFTYGTREPFVGVYHPRTGTGTVHIADPAELPVHKFWSWGNDRDAASWRTALSDDDSAYVELQAGLFRNQETYAFLEPQESVRFTEHWLPVRDLGGITRATVDAVLHMERSAPARVTFALDVVREFPGARVRVRDSGKDVLSTSVSLSPRDVWRGHADNVSSMPVTFELEDGSGRVVLRHTEKAFNLTSAAHFRAGPQSNERPSRSTARSAGDFLEAATLDELEGRRLAAMKTYRDGLAQFPKSPPLLKAAGRLAVALGWTEGALWQHALEKAGAREGATPPPPSQRPVESIEWLQAAYVRNTTDFETQYYLGLALDAAARSREAAPHLESAQRFRSTRAASSLQLARMSMRTGDHVAALRHVSVGLAEAPRASAIGALEVAVLRELGRRDEARDRLRYWQTVDPTLSVLRYESTLLGESSPELWQHLAVDASRVLDVADHYLASGARSQALALAGHEYTRVESPPREPGSVPPGESPLVAYYRAFLRSGQEPAVSDLAAAAASLPLDYVFPHRRSSFAVLSWALRVNARDRTARFLLGSLYLASGLVEPAVDAWQRLRGQRPAIPTLHRNLGLALLHGSGDIKAARSILEEGTLADPQNVEVYLALDGVLSATSASSSERVDALRRFPAPGRMPSSMVFKLALALAESGDAAGAERLFHGRFFPREEGGTNVRAVYAHVRLTSARLAAGASRCREALAILDSLGLEQPDLAFTAGGLGDTLTSGPMARQAAAIEFQCGRAGAARKRWQRLEQVSATAGPMAVALAHEARLRLGTAASATGRRRLEEALASTTRTLESADTSSPGMVEYARGLLLAALGRRADSRAALGRVFIYPDRSLSHALARLALAEHRAAPVSLRAPRDRRP